MELAPAPNPFTILVILLLAVIFGVGYLSLLFALPGQ
jgi:hypothetical protein